MEHKLDVLVSERLQLRIRWREARDKKINRKIELLRQGLTIDDVRHDKFYRALKKNQKYLSKMIRHIEIKINRYLQSIGGIDEK